MKWGKVVAESEELIRIVKGNLFLGFTPIP
jgi:hypothetical protein